MNSTARPNNGTLVDRIAQTVTKRIRKGEWPQGSKLPSVRQFARDCGVSNETVLRAYDKLVALGYLEPRRGSGFFIKRSGQRPNVPDALTGKEWTGTTGSHGRWRQLLLQDTSRPNPGDGLFPDDWMDHSAVLDALRSLKKITSGALGGYADPNGYLPLRQQLQCKLLEQGIDALPSQIITSAGAADALHLVIWSHFFPGQYVAVEDPAPFIHVQRLLASGLEIVRVPRRHDGPDLDALQAVCERYKPRAFFCSSILQNPTSTNLSPHKAHQILKIADAFDLLIVDDDTYGDLSPMTGNGNTVRLATLDQLQRVIHIGSFSKTIAPALRSGFIAAHPEHVARILLFKSVGAIHGPLLNERIVYRILSEGRYRHHCDQLRNRLQSARKDVHSALSEMGCDMRASSDGLYLWGTLGNDRNADRVADAMATRGFQTAPGSAFSLSPEMESHMRFNIPSTLARQALPALRECLMRSS
ncbi:PLP-dependent aminotransferase family protein [Luteimonas sp. XNQY3]|nr:PLP-dependent aminotransferase family protein [Luteimonas sp. XNQY3]MCD9007048.1 PLP-dependent aminotransferase family protein [Luteimonas sp. XNQY3]